MSNLATPLEPSPLELPPPWQLSTRADGAIELYTSHPRWLCWLAGIATFLATGAIIPVALLIGLGWAVVLSLTTWSLAWQAWGGDVLTAGDNWLEVQLRFGHWRSLERRIVGASLQVRRDWRTRWHVVAVERGKRHSVGILPLQEDADMLAQVLSERTGWPIE